MSFQIAIAKLCSCLPRDAAAHSIGTAGPTLTHWLKGRYEPDDLTKRAVMRQLREGRDASVDQPISGREFSTRLKVWRAGWGISQPQAALALAVNHGTLRGWECKGAVPAQPGLSEVLHAMRQPVDVGAVKAATKKPRPVEPQKLARLLKGWRKRRALTQCGAAAALGVSSRAVCGWEKQREYPQNAEALVSMIEGPLRNAKAARKESVTPRQFAAMVRRWRRSRGLNQMEGCEALGLPADQAIISDWERCKGFPRPDRMKAVLERMQDCRVESPKLKFGGMLREWRKRRGLTQAEASREMGLNDQGLICRWELRKAFPRPARLNALMGLISRK